jgi:hypothetical protein
MLKRLLKSFISKALGKQNHHHHYSSSDWKRKKYHNHSHYGHKHYKKLHRSGKFSSFSDFFSS